MAALRTLTVNLVDLNMQTAVINGAAVEISLERVATADSFAVVPTLAYRKTSDATGVLMFRLLPNNEYTKYRITVMSSAGQQTLDAFFVMPDQNASLAPLLNLSVYPDGFNSPDQEYYGIYRGEWDMSGGTGVIPSVPVSATTATYTNTTMTPGGSLTPLSGVYVAAVETAAFPAQAVPMQLSFPMPVYVPGDTVNLHIMALCNSSATLADLMAVFNGQEPSTPVYVAFLMQASGVTNPPFSVLYTHNNGVEDSNGISPVSFGDIAYLVFDPSDNGVTLTINGDSVGPFSLDVQSFPDGDTMKLVVITSSVAQSPVFDAGYISFNLSDTTGGYSGFGASVNATPPVGARDLDWLNVSAGGYFYGKTTIPGDYVKLISGKTNLIIDRLPAVLSVAGVSPGTDGDVPLSASDVGAIPASQKGAASGVATLDASSKLAQHLPASLLDQDASNRLVTDAEKSTWSGKETAISAGTSGQYWRGDKSWQTLDSSAVGLGSVTNTAQFARAGDTLTGTAGAGFFGAIKQSSKPGTPSDGLRLYADASGRLSWVGESGYARTFDGTANTADRIYTLQDIAGTMALVPPQLTDSAMWALSGVPTGYRVRNTTYGNVVFWWNGARWIPEGPLRVYSYNLSDTLTGTTAETLMREVAIPSRYIGPQGSVQVWASKTNNNSGGTKTFFVRISMTSGGTGSGTTDVQLVNLYNTTATSSSYSKTMFAVSETGQWYVSSGSASDSGTSSIGASTRTVDFTSGNTAYVKFVGTLSGGSDNQVLTSAAIVINPGF